MPKQWINEPERFKSPIDIAALCSIIDKSDPIHIPGV